MSVELDWKIDEDEVDDPIWTLSNTDTRSDFTSFPGYCGMERNPELLRFYIGNGLPDKANPIWLYLFGSLISFGLLLALFFFI